MQGNELGVYRLNRTDTADFLLGFRWGKAVTSFLDGVRLGGLPGHSASVRNLQEILNDAGESASDEEYSMLEAAVLNLDWALYCAGAYAEVSRETGESAFTLRREAANASREELRPDMRLIGRSLRKYWTLGTSVREDGRYPALEWYENTKTFFDRVFGDDSTLFIALLAATSPRVKVRENLGLASSLYMKITSGRGLAEKEPGLLGTTRISLRRALRGQFLLGPKIYSFFKNMMGDKWLVTLDMWTIMAAGTSDREEGKNSLGFPLVWAWKLFKPGEMKAPLIKRDYYVRISDSEFSYKTGGNWITLRRDGTESIERAQVPLIKFKQMTSKEKYPYRYGVVADALRQIARTVPDPRYVPAGRNNPKISKRESVSPRDFQAAVWSGIKMERDPVGMEDFAAHYLKYFGEEPLPQRWESNWRVGKTFPPYFLEKTGQKEEKEEEEEEDAGDEE